MTPNHKQLKRFAELGGWKYVEARPDELYGFSEAHWITARGFAYPPVLFPDFPNSLQACFNVLTHFCKVGTPDEINFGIHRVDKTYNVTIEDTRFWNFPEADGPTPQLAIIAAVLAADGWQDEDRTYTPAEQQLDTRLDCKPVLGRAQRTG